MTTETVYGLRGETVALSTENNDITSWTKTLKDGVTTPISGRESNYDIMYNILTIRDISDYHEGIVLEREELVKKA